MIIHKCDICKNEISKNDPVFGVTIFDRRETPSIPTAGLLDIIDCCEKCSARIIAYVKSLTI